MPVTRCFVISVPHPAGGWGGGVDDIHLTLMLSSRLGSLVPPATALAERRHPLSPLRRRVLMANGFLQHSVASHLKNVTAEGGAFCGVSGFLTAMYNLLLMGSTAK